MMESTVVPSDTSPLLTTPSGAVYTLENFSGFPFANSIVFRRYVEESEVSDSPIRTKYCLKRKINSIPTVTVNISNANENNADQDAGTTLEWSQLLLKISIAGYHTALRRFGSKEISREDHANIILRLSESDEVFLSRGTLINVPDVLDVDDMQAYIAWYVFGNVGFQERQVEPLIPFFQHSIHGLHASGAINIIIDIGDCVPTNPAIKGPIYSTLAFLARMAKAYPGAYIVVATIKVSTACEAAVRTLLHQVPGDLEMIGGTVVNGDMRNDIVNWQFTGRPIEDLHPSLYRTSMRLNERLYLNMQVG